MQTADQEKVDAWFIFNSSSLCKQVIDRGPQTLMLIKIVEGVGVGVEMVGDCAVVKVAAAEPAAGKKFRHRVLETARQRARHPRRCLMRAGRVTQRDKL
jgi:hypothetical protein